MTIGAEYEAWSGRALHFLSPVFLSKATRQASPSPPICTMTRSFSISGEPAMPQIGMRILYSALRSLLHRTSPLGGVVAVKVPHRAQRVGAAVIDRTPRLAGRPRTARCSRNRTYATRSAGPSCVEAMDPFDLVWRVDPIHDIDASIGHSGPAVAGRESASPENLQCAAGNFSSSPVSLHTPSRSARAIAANRRPGDRGRSAARTTPSQGAARERSSNVRLL